MSDTRIPTASASLAGALVCAIALSLPSGAAAQGKSVKEVFNYKGADRTAMLEAGARKEGEVMMYTTGTQIAPILNRFREKYPYIKLNVHRAGSTDITRQVMEEYKAGRYVPDTIFLNMGGLRIMRDAGILSPFYTPEEKHYGADAVEKDKYWIAAWESYVSLAYNTKHFSDAEVPMTYDALLDPKWKGKLAVSSRASTLANWIGVMLLTKGEDYLKKLGQQDVTIYKISGRALSNLVVSGEVPISPAVYQAHMLNSARKGATVKWHALGAVYAGAGGGAMASKAPSPHAGMLLADFFLSKEGQTMRTAIGDASARLDLASHDKPKQIFYLTDRPNYHKEFEAWQKLSTQTFGPAKDRAK